MKRIESDVVRYIVSDESGYSLTVAVPPSLEARSVLECLDLILDRSHGGVLTHIAFLANPSVCDESKYIEVSAAHRD